MRDTELYRHLLGLVAPWGVDQVALPWAEPNSRFTAVFERLAIDVLAA